MITIRKVVDANEWDSLVRQSPYSPMTQASDYGVFSESMGDKTFIIGAYEDGVLIGGALVIVIHARRGSYFYLPYGPLTGSLERFDEILDGCTKYLKENAREHHVSFIRISPFIEKNEKHSEILRKAGFRKAPIHALAETTCVLDISHDEEKLLAQMNKNHRNLIRRCEKEGVRIESYTDHEKLKEFHELHSYTAKRHQFVRFSNEYVEHEFQAFEKSSEAVVWYGFLPDGTLDSSAIVYYYGSTAAYRHGASLGQNNKIPTPYLIQWSAIREAKKRGKKWYNFWGVAPEGAPDSHPFKGITHFKKGFGGEVKDLIECHDLVIEPIKYYPTWIFETLRRIKRGF
jgi:peptidoglycan pentaglycine glycine transferase (the first glycine)